MKAAQRIDETSTVKRGRDSVCAAGIPVPRGVNGFVAHADFLNRMENIWFDFFVFGLLISICNSLVQGFIETHEANQENIWQVFIMVLVTSGILYNLGDTKEEGLLIGLSSMTINSLYLGYQIIKKKKATK